MTRTNQTLLTGVLLACVSCTTAGPFVTSISSDGRGNLIVEKSMVEYNSFMGVVSNKATTTSSIKLLDEQAVRRLNAEIQPKPSVWTGESD